MKNKPLMGLLLIVVLVLLNLWHWLPRWKSNPVFAAKSSSGELTLNFPAPLEDEEKIVHRDLFAIGYVSLVHHLMKKSRVITLLPLFTPTPSTADGSVAEVNGGYRLLGVVSRGGQIRALIGKGEQTFSVVKGDEIEGVYQVLSVTDSEVYLTEKQTGNTLRLHIWDQQKGVH